MRVVKTIVILGAGESGTGAALLAKAKGHEVFLSDRSAIGADYKQQLVDHHIDFEEGKHDKNGLSRSYRARLKVPCHRIGTKLHYSSRLYLSK